MKILIITQYFWPENFLINDLARGLKEKGCHINILTGKPNYPGGDFYEGYSFFKNGDEYYDKIKIFRSNLFPRKNSSGFKIMLNYFSFAFFASIKALFLKEKYDLIFVYEPSPITVGIPAVLISKKLKIPIYFWVQDLWPESISAAGYVKNKFVLNSLDSLTRWIYRNSKKVLIQSEGFRKYILKQGVENNKIIYYPNSTESLFDNLMPKKNILDVLPKVPFSIMFAGNIGESQDFENLLKAAKIIKKKTRKIHFIIIGDGRKKDYVKNKINEYDLKNNFHMLGFFPKSDMPHFFALADALLVSLKKSKIFSLTIPSKIQSYLASGKPIIGSLDGEGAKVILKSNSGLVAKPGNHDQLAEKILDLYKMSASERQNYGKNARKYFENNFEREKLINKLITIFESR